MVRSPHRMFASGNYACMGHGGVDMVAGMKILDACPLNGTSLGIDGRNQQDVDRKQVDIHLLD